MTITEPASQQQSVLRVGDRVMWRGSFGHAAAAVATVVGIEVSDTPRSKYGAQVSEVPWARIDYACVDLDTGNWAYGEQLEPIS